MFTNLLTHSATNNKLEKKNLALFNYNGQLEEKKSYF